MLSSAQTEDPKVAQIRAAALQRGYSPAEIDQKLMDAGLLKPPAQQSGGVGGGYGMLSQIGQGLMHYGGLAARGVGQGIGATGDIMSQAPPPYGMGGMLPPGTMQGGMTNAMNRMGVPQPQTPGERIGVAGAEGAAMGGPFGMGAAALGAGANMAGQTAGEMGASPLGQMAVSAGVGFGLPVAGALLSGGIRAALAGASERRKAAEQALQLIQAGNPDAAVTLGQVAEGGAARTIEGGLKNIPGGGQVFAKTLQKQADEMGARVEATASKLGRPASTEVVGKAVQQGIEGGFIPNFRSQADQLYQRVYNLVPPNSPIRPTAVTQLIAKQNDMMGMARELSDDISSPGYAKLLNHIADAAESGDGRIPFTVLKEVRSRLGAMLSGEDLIPDINLRDVKRLYGAITEDMGAGIQEVGGTPATQAWNRANTFWQKGTDRIEKVLDPLVRKRLPEQAFTSLMSGTKDGATALRSTLQSLDAGSAGLVQSHVLRQLGRMPDESFSPELFLRKLNGLAPTAQNALFSRDPEVGQNLLALAKVAEARKASGRVMFNPSGTAQNMSFQAIMNAIVKMGSLPAAAITGGAAAGGGMGAAAAALATPIVANQLAERVFTNPRMIQWLVRQTRVPFGAMRQELAQLAKDAQKWGPADQSVALDLTGAMGNLDWRSILMAQAAADASATRAQGQ